MKKGAKEENLTDEERWAKEEKEKSTERERERERENSVQKRKERKWVWLGCWNNNKKNIKWLFKEKSVYNR